MAAILYTSTDAIRASVGVTVLEFPETAFTDQDMSTQVKVALTRYVPNHATWYSEGTALGATADQVHKADLLKMFCLYWCSIRAVKMIMAMRQKVSDGKQEVQRFQVRLSELLEALQDQLDEVIEDLIELVDGTVAPHAVLSLSKPTYDPVTNR
jgi:hypothetical protein